MHLNCFRVLALQGGSRLSKKLFVGGVGEVSDEEFRAYFARFGSIVVGCLLRHRAAAAADFCHAAVAAAAQAGHWSC